MLEAINVLKEKHKKASDHASELHDRFQKAEANNWPDVERFEHDFFRAWDYAKGIFDSIKELERYV